MRRRAPLLIVVAVLLPLVSSGCLNIYHARDLLPPQTATPPKYEEMILGVIEYSFSTNLAEPVNSTQHADTREMVVAPGTIWLLINISVKINVLPDIIRQLGIPLADPYVAVTVTTPIGEEFYANRFEDNAHVVQSIDGPMDGAWIIHVEAVGYGINNNNDSYKIEARAFQPAAG